MQGIRNELFANDSYAAVSADDIRQQFPAQTNLEIYWPSRSLLDAPMAGGGAAAAAMGSWIKRPSGNPPPLPVPAAPSVSSVIRKTPTAAATQGTEFEYLAIYSSNL